MLTLSKQEYRNKVRGCWLGKNIGGTLGAPFEAVRAENDIDFYTTRLDKGVLPNDDLDLQLAWLNAAERFGIAVSAKELAEYWITAITPNWAEYGVGKSNLRFGLEPPYSGGYNNAFKDSNGAWIRSELWACLMPGHPDLAVKYAYEDACVDHADEGVYAEVFTAALESAAFAVSDLDKLVDIALSYIPQDSEVARAVKLVIDCHKKGLNWKQARMKLLTEVPDSFGCQRHDNPNKDNLPAGDWGFDAPANVGIVVLGWLYGEGDFGKSICIAAGCGEDGDCTTATLGAILGIIFGADGIPQKWIDPVGDEIATCTLNLKSSLVRIPKTVTELTDRTAKLMPSFMREHFDMFADGAEIRLAEDAEQYDHARQTWMFRPYTFKDYYPTCHAVFTAENAMMRLWVNAPDGTDIHEGETVKLELHAENISGFVGTQLWLELRWLLPEGWSCDKGSHTALFLNQYHCGPGNAFCTACITAGPVTQALTTVVLEVTAHDRPGKLYVPVQFIAKA